MNIYSKHHPPLGFYVYAYLREDGSPYYIGKGKGIRAWAKEHSVGLPTNNKIVILEQNLTVTGALALERQMIKWYGRKDLPYTDRPPGILRNRTDGGDGAVGPKSEEHKQKQRKKKCVGHGANVSAALRGRKNPWVTKLQLGIKKPKKVCRLIDRTEMDMANYNQWCDRLDNPEKYAIIAKEKSERQKGKSPLNKGSIVKPKVCRLSDRKEMGLGNFLRWVK